MSKGTLKLAGCFSPIFTPSAIEAIAAKSSCLPRVINNIANTTLMYGAEQNLKSIDEEAVYAAAAELGM